MRILHTSDWHLGRSLSGRKRNEEFSAFLKWLARTIEDEAVDVLLIAGDVFDSTTPNHRAQELYYRFLSRVSGSCCRSIIVVAGNHDSPSFLNAPREMLRTLNVHVVGAMTRSLEDEVIEIFDVSDGVLNPDQSAIVCAVPYLRDRDIRTVEPGETIDRKNEKLIEGIKKHYTDIVKLAEAKRKKQLQASPVAAQHCAIPIIAMGHLFTSGGKTVDGDGVRELYVGSLAHVGGDVFPASIDYLALGHLHVPQTVANQEHIRYCGSPLPMGFGEAGQQKQVVVVEFNNRKPSIRAIPVPCFQQLVRIVGSLEDILAEVERLKGEDSRAWLEIDYTGSDVAGSLRDLFDEALTGTAMEIRRIKNRRIIDRVINAIAEDETLDDLDTGDVFTRCLDAFDVPDEEREELTASYKEIVTDLLEHDKNAD